MTFRYIDSLELNIEFELNVLKRNTQRYSSLLYQHEGVLIANSERIGNLDNVGPRLLSFLNKAKELNVDLAVTPEYSCPWDVIRSIINSPESWPNVGKLWAVCCESIKPAELIQFKADFERENITIFYSNHFENSDLSFIDPLIYIFRVQKDNVDTLQLLVQYKTHHMGVFSGGDIERNNIILGSDMYILRNSATSINLVTLICSEAMNFPHVMQGEVSNHVEWEDKPFLILNPQLNPDAAHQDFRNFRQFVFSFSDKEIISVNWNNKSSFSTGLMMRDNCSRSAYYIKSNQINTTDTRIIQNHTKGLYYFFCKQDRHYFLLSSTPHCFYVKNLPVKISNGVGAQSRRDGPEVVTVFRFNNENSFDVIESVNDGHIDFVTETGCNNIFLLDANISVLDKERLICLCVGDVDSDKTQNWSSVQYLSSMNMNFSDEKNVRFTVGRSESNQGEKARHIDAINHLQEIIEARIFPDCISDLTDQNVRIGFVAGSHLGYYRHNILLDTGEPKNATLAYVGPTSDAIVERTFFEIRSLFEVNDNDRNRVVVYYRRGSVFQAKFSSSGTNITGSDNYTDVSFIR